MVAVCLLAATGSKNMSGDSTIPSKPRIAMSEPPTGKRSSSSLAKTVPSASVMTTQPSRDGS